MDEPLGLRSDLEHLVSALLGVELVADEVGVLEEDEAGRQLAHDLAAHEFEHPAQELPRHPHNYYMMI